MVPSVLVALVPVVAFLLALFFMDSFKLVRPRAVLLALGYGALAALGAQLFHGWLFERFDLPVGPVSRYLAPVTEETLKAGLIVALLASRRIGFAVDAAILGFAVGTGFALAENLGYLNAMPDATLLLWFVRGLGTAVLQGATTAIFAMVSRALIDRQPDRAQRALVPGWALAVGLHSLFNHRLLPPVAQTLVLLIVLPLLVLWIYTRSERTTREWVSAGMDLDIELLRLMESDLVKVTRFGQYLERLRWHFPGEAVANMFCLLRLELELSVQAKALLMAREAGLEMKTDEDLAISLAERRFLEESIGTAGLLALRPLQVTSHRDQWHRFLLRQARTRP